ncbi:MAG TPA: glycosyltransferase [Solirubrobacterales bacterium]|nr:glycosyltransferase [Solirubrobacterales bacterium]
MRICVVSAEHSPYGGIGHALRRQVEVLSSRHEVVLIERPEPSERLARMSFASEDHLRSAAVLEEIEKAYEGTDGPDVLEVCDYRALGLVTLQARAAGHPLLRATTVAIRLSSTAELVALHDGRLRRPEEQRAGELEREQFRLADRLLWPGGDTLAAYRRYYGELLPEGVKTGRPFPVAPPPDVPDLGSDGPLRILYAGRLQRVKGAMDLVDACLRLPSDDWELTLIGADTETAALGQSVKLTIERMCEGDPRVRIEDAVPHEDLQRRFGEHHLLALPSNFEFCANVALEAMRAGTPVLATPVGAQVEFVGDGGGWLAGDVGAPALGEALARLLEEREEVERVRSSGEVFRAFRRFTDPDDFLAAYETLPEPPRPARAVAPEPTVTAVIPYHRAHRYVEEAVGSLLAQTHRALDVIVVNDGSFEPEDAVLDRLAEDPRVRVVAQLQRGDLMARRLGIELARGEYLMMFDADNVLEPEFVARALAMFRDQPELAYVTCWLRHIDPDGKELDGGGYAPLGNRVLAEEEENWDGDTAALVPRRVFDAFPEAFPEQKAMQGDWLLYRYLRERGEYGAVIPERLVRYRVHPDSNLRSSDQRLHVRSWEEGSDWRKLAATKWTAQR